jgi:tetratricopeptide (TPR) repeat protein
MESQPRKAHLADVAVACLIGLAVAACYAPALSAGFVFDDHMLIESGPTLRGPLWKIWFSPELPDYWPLTWTSLWLESRAWGDLAWGYHVVNVALHAGASILVWRVLRALRVPGAWLAGLLFGIHPVGVESAAWISERKNTLSGVLALGAVLAYVRFDERRAKRDHAVALALFLLALLAKTSIVMLPFVLLGIAFARRGGVRRNDLIDTVPFFGLAVAAGLVTLWFQRTRAMAEQLLPQRGPLERLGGAAWALASYLEKALLPVRVGIVYAGWPVPPSSPLFYLPLLGVAAGAWLLWRSRRTRWGWGISLTLAYHALMVLPVLGLIDIAYFAVGPVANHLQYLALIGPVALVAYATALCQSRSRLAVRAVAALAVVLVATATFRRAQAYESDLTLWRAAARDAPDSLFALWVYTDLLASQGERQAALVELSRAAEEARDPAMRHRARSLWFIHTGGFDDAMRQAAAADELHPDAEFDLELAQILTRAGQPSHALSLLTSLVARAPRNLDVRYWLGAALTQSGRFAEAYDVLTESCRLAPNDAQSRGAVALVLVRLGRMDEARQQVAIGLGTDARDPRVVEELDALIAAKGPAR